MSETIPTWAYYLLTLIATLALAFHASDWREYAAVKRKLSHAVLLIGWASIVARLWHGVGTDQSISFAGGIGVFLLACGVILRSSGR